MSPSNVSVHEHGGYCCGRLHIEGFHTYKFVLKDYLTFKREFREWYSYPPDDEDGEVMVDDLCVEVTLTHTQAFTEAEEGEGIIAGKTWHEVLTKEFGFKCVFAFTNPNTRNKVYVYFYAGQEESVPDLSV